MEEESETTVELCCWRKEVDFNLKRLHSLLFGADLALDKEDFSSAHLLSLRLIGFLDSRSQNDVDRAFIPPIRRDALSKLDTALRSLVPESDRYIYIYVLIYISIQLYVCLSISFIDFELSIGFKLITDGQKKVHFI